ncbi:MAG TPA: YceI family protein [Gemmatimonadaceae bacterium]|nr:YceI family protein [Gemmatimonadaceae bacterium]
MESSHSRVAFSIAFVGLPVRGSFDDVGGVIVYAAKRPEASSVTVAIATSSLHTGSEHRDGHLKSSDFFDAKRFPTILFQSTGISRLGDKLVMHGRLRMHGVTRDLSFPFQESASSPILEPHGSTLIQFTASLRLARRDFGITGGSTYNDWFDNVRQASMGDSVDVILEVTGWDPDHDRSHRYDAALKTIARDGMPATIARIRRIHAATPDSLRDSEWEFDQIGQAFMQRGDYANAVEILGLNADIFPKSASAQAALARAYELAGKRDAAATYTSKALAIDPDAPRALELRRRLGR